MDSNKDRNGNNHYGHHHQQQTNQISFGNMMQSTSSSSAHPGNFSLNKDGGAYDMGELDQALFLYLDGQDHPAQEQRQNSGISNRPYTLNIFPSQPMHVEPPPESSKGNNNNGLVSSPMTSGSKRSSEPSMELLSNPRNDGVSVPQAKAVKREGNRRALTSSSEHEGPKTPDPKTLRRLAQNREAARKSRLRKKAYVQQLETSRMRLTQLEQEIQRARTQGFHLGGNAVLGGEQGLQVSGNITSDAAAIFDMEYARWLDEHQRIMVEVRRAVHDHMPENELSVYVDNCLAHYDQVINMKSAVASKDVIHLVSGIWKTPAERCFMWIGGFRPSELIKIIPHHIEPLTENQLIAIYGLQQSTQESEEALSQGLEALNSSLSQTLAADPLDTPNMNNYMGQMVVALRQLNALEGLVRQADGLRRTILHRLHQILTIRQTAKCLLAISEYFHRLRTLSSLWMARPRPEQG